MSETTTCPSCQRALRVPEELLGQDVKCPACGTTFTATFASPSPPPPPRREEPPPPRPAPREARPAPRGEDRPRSGPRDEERELPRRSPRNLTPHRGGLIFALGLLAILGFMTIPLGQIAWWMGANDLREIKAGRMDPEGEGMTQIGRILGMISSIIALLSVVACLIIGFILLLVAAVNG